MVIVRFSTFRFFGALLLAASVLSGCDSSSKLSDTEHLANARALRAKGDDKAAVVEIRNALQKNPKNADARVMLAEIYVKGGRGKEAQTELEIALQRGANAARVKLPLARAYMLQGNYDGAASEAAITLASPPGDRAGLLEVQGRARIAMRQPEQGCPLFDQARAADPQLIEAYWGAATCAAVKGDNQLARSIVGEAIKAKPQESQSWVLLGDIDRVDHKLDEANKSYAKAIELKKNNVDAYLGRALAEVEQRKLTEAEADVKQIDTIQKGHPLASYVTGIIRFRQARYTEAKTAFETVLTTAPTHFQSILWLGLANFQLRNYEAAVTQLNQFVSLQPNAVRVRAILAQARARLGGFKQANADLGVLDKLDIDDPQTLAMIGETHTFLGNPTAGSQFLAKAVEMQPDAVETRVNLATSLLEKNDIAGAIKQLQTALDKQPDSLPANTMMVRALIQKKDLPAALEKARSLQTQFPQNPVGGDFVGSIQLLQGDEAGAKATFDKLLESNPKFFPAANNLALLAIKHGQLTDAQTYYQKALQANPDSLAAMLGLHNVERALGHSDQADKYLQQAVQSHPSEALPAQMLAQSYLSSRAPRKALAATEEASRAHPGDPGLLEVRGLAYAALNEPASAIVAFNKLVQVRGDSADAYVYLASANTALGDRSSAKTALANALRIDPGNYRARLALGIGSLNDGKTDDALTIAKALERDKPNLAGGYVLEGSALAEAKKVREGIKVLSAAVQRFPKATEARLALAKAHSAAGDLPAMIAGLVEWRAADPGNSIVNSALGEAYLRVKDDANALVAYRAQIAIDPNDVRALNNAAFLLRKQDPAQATTYANRAIQIDPQNADAFDTLGQIQTESGDFKPAIASFERSRTLAPKDGRPHYHLAVALAKSGQTQLARRELERLLAGSPTFDGAADARALLQQLPKS